MQYLAVPSISTQATMQRYDYYLNWQKKKPEKFLLLNFFGNLLNMTDFRKRFFTMSLLVLGYQL